MTTFATPEARARAAELSKQLGRQPERRDVSLAPVSIDRAARSVEFVCSTAIQDRHGTIVKQKWRLEWFQKNPIALWAHDSRSPLGRWEDVRVEKGQLVGRLFFAKNDELADRIFNLVDQGIIKAVSVGFIPHSYKWEMQDDVEVLVFDDNELLEVSPVSIGANPEALAKELPLNPAERSATTPAAPAAPAPAAAANDAGAALERRAVDAEARATRLEGELVETRQKLTAAETAKAAAEAATAVEKSRADKLDNTRKAAKVEALVGVKYDPVDRAFWLEKCVKDEADFDATMARTRDLPTAVNRQIVSAKDPSPPAGSLDADQASAKALELARKRASEKNVPLYIALSEVHREHPELCA